MIIIHFPHVRVPVAIVSRVAWMYKGYDVRQGRCVLSACTTMQRLLSAVVLYSPSLRPRLSLHKLASYHLYRVRLLAAPRSYSSSLHLGSSLSLSPRHVSTLWKLWGPAALHRNTNLSHIQPILQYTKRTVMGEKIDVEYLEEIFWIPLTRKSGFQKLSVCPQAFKPLNQF